MINLSHFIKRLRIRSFKRFVPFTTTYPGFICKVVDKSSFLFMYEEIFDKEIYKFKSDTNSPFIIDCGSNIGLSVIYFKKLFPQAKILTFEPDPEIFKVLEENLHSSDTGNDVERIQACLASTTGEVVFYPDQADGGTMLHQNVGTHKISVPSMELGPFMTRPVDFLKIDIEGAEHEVLESIKTKLPLVKNIFVEYHSFVDKTQCLDNILFLLKQAGFRYYIEHIGIRSKNPYSHRTVDHGMDLQINIYGYRV